MAHTKAQKAARGNRDSQSKRLGIKRFGGEKVKVGYVLVRQRGTRFYPGEGVKKGKDDTLYAVREGIVRFYRRYNKKYIAVV